MIHAASSAVTDCQPNDNVEALRVFMDAAGIEARPVWKPMHLQPVFKNNRYYGGRIGEKLFANGLCLPSGTALTFEQQQYISKVIIEEIKK